jgi:hypothetical protein
MLIIITIPNIDNPPAKILNGVFETAIKERTIKIIVSAIRASAVLSLESLNFSIAAFILMRLTNLGWIAIFGQHFLSEDFF